MTKLKQVVFYLKEDRASKLKSYHEKVTGPSGVKSLSSVVREVVDGFIDEVEAEGVEGCFCSVCEAENMKQKPTVVKNKKTTGTEETKQTIHSIPPAKKIKEPAGKINKAKLPKG